MFLSLSDLQFWKTRRYLVTFMLFLGFFNIYSLRINLSVAIVAMTRGTSTDEVPEFDWDSKKQGLLLSSFFYGYITTQLLGGLLTRKVGGRRLFGGGIFVTAVLTLLSPVATHIDFSALVAVRIISGVFEGVTYPSLPVIWSKWAPPLERSKLNSIVFAGNYVGIVLMMPICGILSESFGWESVFYVTGALGVIWFILWAILVKESPDDDPYISIEEKKYITESLGNGAASDTTQTIPWKSILTSLPVWAIAVATVAQTWGDYTIMTQLPTYLKDTLDLNLSDNGLISCLPYLMLAIMLVPTGYVADWIRKRGYLTTTQVRRYFNSGFLIQAFFMLMVTVLKHPTYSIVSLILAVGFGSFPISGYAVNHLDIAPQFSGILMGIANTFGTASGIISPLLSGFIVQNRVSSFKKSNKPLNNIFLNIFRI